MTQTLTLTELVEPPPADDPFRYGSRYVLRTRADGTLYSENLPLTLWDVLHPQEGDHITQSRRHQKEVRYLTDVIEARANQQDNSLVLSDTPIYWDTPGLSHHAPDVAVIFGLRERREQYTSFNVGPEAARPELIIEVVSPHVRGNDVDTKLAEYHAARVPTYVIVDRESEEDWPTILAYTWEAAGYRPLALDDRDCLLLPRLNLRLCANQNRITLYDAATGQEMGDFDAISQQLEVECQAREKAEEEARLAKFQAEAQEAARLKAEEATRRAEENARQEAEARLKAEENARQEAEARLKAEDRAKSEADARADLERRLRALEAKLNEQQKE